PPSSHSACSAGRGENSRVLKMRSTMSPPAGGAPCRPERITGVNSPTATARQRNAYVFIGCGSSHVVEWPAASQAKSRSEDHAFLARAEAVEERALPYRP